MKLNRGRCQIALTQNGPAEFSGGVQRRFPAPLMNYRPNRPNAFSSAADKRIVEGEKLIPDRAKRIADRAKLIPDRAKLIPDPAKLIPGSDYLTISSL
jgi:hypothetical protein